MNFEANFDDDVELSSDSDHGGFIIPKQTCEHVRRIHLIEDSSISLTNQCIDCESSNENWLCLSCGEIHCSRYVNNHGEEHWLFTLFTDEQDSTGHCLTINLQDLSVWCYPCKSYIVNIRLNPLINYLQSLKFHSVPPVETILPPPLPPVEISTIIAIQDPSLLEELATSHFLLNCDTIKLRSASIDELTRLHSSDYVNMLVSAEKSHSKLPELSYDLQCSETSLIQARISAGTTIDVMETIVESGKNAFILVTSPGHRAFSDHGNGTSIYNNIALAINNILQIKPLKTARRSSLALIDCNNHIHREGATPIEDAICHMINILAPASTLNGRESSISVTDAEKVTKTDRVLVVDFTSEHGCGLQSIYYESNQVFYLSVHRETHQHRSSYHECGKNEGLGYTINIPLASFDSLSDRDYLTIMDEIILPICEEYKAELIVVAVDFQIPNLTAQCYSHLIEQFNQMKNSKLVVILDGDLSSISSKSSYVEEILGVLVGQKNEPLKLSDEIHRDVREKLDLVKGQHRRYWTCFH